MKNITIKLDDDVAKWSKVWAAENNTSVSRIVGDLLTQLRREKNGYEKAMDAFLSTPAQPISGEETYPKRDDLYER